jgi:hypothetical protein
MGFGFHGQVTGECGAGSGERVDRIGLADPAPGGAIGSVDLEHGESRGGQQAGQTGAVGPGAFDTDPQQVPV